MSFQFFVNLVDMDWGSEILIPDEKFLISRETIKSIFTNFDTAGTITKRASDLTYTAFYVSQIFKYRQLGFRRFYSGKTFNSFVRSYTR